MYVVGVPPHLPTCYHPTDCLFVPFTKTEEKVKLCHFTAVVFTPGVGCRWRWRTCTLCAHAQTNKHSGVEEKEAKIIIKKKLAASLLIVKIIWLFFFLFCFFFFNFWVLEHKWLNICVALGQLGGKEEEEEEESQEEEGDQGMVVKAQVVTVTISHDPSPPLSQHLPNPPHLHQPRPHVPL